MNHIAFTISSLLFEVTKRILLLSHSTTKIAIQKVAFTGFGINQR
uniref:Uncharacterized protein n=1 Tax=Rhizophora mucronata TaxID=61149 RepID=A0A2P2P2P2_RHIMU